MGQFAEVEIHKNLPGCAFLLFPSFETAKSFAVEFHEIPLSSRCRAKVKARPCRDLPSGIETVALDGLSDIGEKPTALLLLRNFPAKLSEDAIFHWLLHDLGLDVTRILLIRRNDMFEFSAGIAFAEFKSIDLAGKALHIVEHLNQRDSATPAELKHIKASHVSMGTFGIAPYPFKNAFRSSGGMMLQYSNPDYFVSEYPVPSESEFFDGPPDNDDIMEEPKEPNLQPVTNPLFYSGHGSKKRKSSPVQSSLSSSVREKLQKWQHKHAELVPQRAPPLSQVSTTPKSYADHQRLNCYLCNRHFESSEKLNTHERVSDLHQYNLQFNKEGLSKANLIREALNLQAKSGS